jgi:hypothetical protein
VPRLDGQHQPLKRHRFLPARRSKEDLECYTTTREAAMAALANSSAAGVILVCAASRPIGENNSSLELARVDERTLDNNSLRIVTLSYARRST